MQLKPDQLNFGALAAERDISAGLRDYFLESESYHRLSAGEKRIALGNRGVGKTAIFKMIAERERIAGNIVVELAPEDYSYELLQRTLAREEAGSWVKQGAYAASWKYLLYVMAMKRLSDQGRLRRGSGKEIHAYLRDHHANINKNPLDTLVSYLKRLEGVKLGTYEAGLKTRELQKLYRLEEVVTLLPVLREVLAKSPVLFLIDELDKGWDASEDAKAFVSGLFQAAVTINDAEPHMRILLSLRKELYDNIPVLYDDAQKYRDVIEVIEWDEPDLLELIARRIGHSIPSLANLSGEQRWNAVFSETLDYRQTKSFNYIVDRTLYRPREIIYFCTEIRDQAEYEMAEMPVNYPTISEAEYKYSEERVKDIASEYRFNYPGLETVFETFRGRVYTFDREELEVHCLGIAVGDLLVSTDARMWVQEMEPDDLIDVLWEVGFLRAQAVGGVKGRRRSGSSYLGPHQISNLNLRQIGRFHVHPMFRTFLGMKEWKKD